MINRMLFGEEILEAIFARSGMTFAELSKHFFRSPVGWEYHISLINCLRSLSEASLIKVDGVKAEGTKEFISYCEYPNDWNEFHNTSAGPEQNKFRTSDEWRRIRGALTEGLQYGSSYRFVCLPSFGKPVFNHTPSPADVFVAMPFNPSMASVYEIIREAAAECDLTINRADEFSSSNPIIGEIWSAICSAKIVIADCSGKNPNVFYEIGMAHTVGKPVILITQKKEDIPFDVRHIRYMEYALNDAGRAELSRRIKDTLMCSLELYNR